MKDEYKCVMCRKRETFLTDKGKFVRFFIAPQTKEILCGECNQINDWVAFSYYNDLRKGERRIKKIK